MCSCEEMQIVTITNNCCNYVIVPPILAIMCREAEFATGPSLKCSHKMQTKSTFIKPTDTLLVSGSAMTPVLFRSKSPMLRVIANLPLTFGCPRLFQVMKPPLFLTLEAVQREKGTSIIASVDSFYNKSKHILLITEDTTSSALRF